jgi:hypothetical protein
LVSPRADQVAPSLLIERIHRQRDGLSALPAADFKNVEMALDHTDPNELHQDAAEQALGDARPDEGRGTLGHRFLT